MQVRYVFVVVACGRGVAGGKVGRVEWVAGWAYELVQDLVAS